LATEHMSHCPPHKSVMVSRGAPIIGIGQLVCWYRPIVVYTIDKYKFLSVP